MVLSVFLIGTNNVWYLFYKLKLFMGNTYRKIKSIKGNE